MLVFDGATTLRPWVQGAFVHPVVSWTLGRCGRSHSLGDGVIGRSYRMFE
jgi:hypothetical protein